MTFEEFIKEVEKRECDYDEGASLWVEDAILNEENVRSLHGAMGVATEAGELLDAYKKHIFYDKPLDAQNIKEEIGDVLWYLAILCREQGITFEDAMAANTRKLEARFGKKFSRKAALNRDLKAEEKALEGME